MWSEHSDRKNKFCTAHIESLDGETTAAIWERVRELLTEQRKNWDYIRVEYWGEGRWVIYPASSAIPGDRIDNVACDVFVGDTKREEARLEDDVLDDEMLDPNRDFDTAMRHLVGRTARQLLEAAALVLSVPVRAFNYDESTPVFEVTP